MTIGSAPAPTCPGCGAGNSAVVFDLRRLRADAVGAGNSAVVIDLRRLRADPGSSCPASFTASSTMISRYFERPERTAKRANDTRNRYRTRHMGPQDRERRTCSARHDRVPATHGSQDAAHHAWSAHTTAFSGTHTPRHTTPDNKTTDHPLPLRLARTTRCDGLINEYKHAA